MFELTVEELYNLRCQIGTSSWGGIRYSPMAFTEQSVAMLSSILNSDTAIEVNIQIIRIFTKIKESHALNNEILSKLKKLEHRLLYQEIKTNKQESDIQNVFKALKNLIETPKKEREQLGYKKSN